ncbi:disease resistance protein RPP13, partial [Morus notabilis]|uniref:disease resistance protein RPP13 n=1 Tax=Morus notabilis TaxID=981085 RepID=UPI000CED5F98
MANAVLSSIIDNLDGLLTQEAFLKDAQVNLEGGEISDATKVWLEQLRENADRINDAIDVFLYYFRQRRQQRPGCAGLLRKPGEIVKALKLRRYIASQIRDIKKSLRELTGRCQIYDFGLSSSGSTDVATPDECEVFGIDSALTTLMTSLVEEPSARTVISLVGEGGIGKTTLARAVYDSVRLHFDCHVWVTVSLSYDIEKILRDMKEVICPTSGQSEEEIVPIEELISLLREFLESKESTFDFVHELKPWSSERAWELFCKNAFREGRCPRELEELSREIVLRCQGRPLVIVAVAGLLSRKEKTKLEWQSMLDHFYDELEKIPQLANVSKDLIFLSFLNLPFYLKSCFLYLGIFPEGYSIIEGRLYRLWISEGFIESMTDKTQEQVAKSRRDKTQEQVAKEYLNELIRRGLVSFEISYGIERHCRIHHLIRDFILARVAELSFCQILEENTFILDRTTRRLSIYGTTKDVLEIIGDSKMRSLFLFNIDELTESFVVSLFERFKLLRVLDFEDAPLDHLPREVGNLFHLKYLNLRVQKLQYLLSSNRFNIRESEYGFNSFFGGRMNEGIGCLEELQTLYLVEPCIDGVSFVKELKKLRKLKILGIGKLTAEMGKAFAASFENMRALFLDLSRSYHFSMACQLTMSNARVPVLDFEAQKPKGIEFMLLK